MSRVSNSTQRSRVAPPHGRLRRAKRPNPSDLQRRLWIDLQKSPLRNLRKYQNRNLAEQPRPLPILSLSPPRPVRRGLSVLAEKDVRVAAAADWTSSDIRVMKGQRLFVTAEGEVDLGNDKKSGPAGIPVSDTRKLMTNRPTGSLIAVIGDDNDNFIYIGRSAEFTAAHNGVLFLSINEGELKDNTGSYRAKVKVVAAK